MSSRFSIIFLPARSSDKTNQVLLVHARRTPGIVSLSKKTFPISQIRLGDASTLRSSPLLQSLHVYFAPDDLDTIKISPLLTHVQTQILDSPNLVQLSMEVGSMGCIIYNIDPKFARLKSKSFPSLEKLTLEAFPLSVENVDYWMANMDWAHMEYLDLRAIDNPTYFFNESMKIASGLPQLKVLRMELPWFRKRRDLHESEDTFRRFLDAPANDTGLSEIALEGGYQPYLQTILNRHGRCLKKLQLHDPERPGEPEREMLSDLDLSDLGRRAPNLEDISIDIILIAPWSVTLPVLRQLFHPQILTVTADEFRGDTPV